MKCAATMAFANRQVILHRVREVFSDLWRVEAVSVVDAVLGTEVEAPTLEGPTQVSIPPGTQPDTVLRLRGKGLPGFGHDRRGDFYLRVRVQVPEQLSSAERDLYERLRALSQT